MGRISESLQDTLYLGNLEARRDWGYAPEFVSGMWSMLQQQEPGDFVLATGATHSVEDFWAAGGYDEDLVNNYGHNDSLFRKQLVDQGCIEQTLDIFCDQSLARCTLGRENSVNLLKKREKIKNLPRTSWDVLRFSWRQEQLYQGRLITGSGLDDYSMKSTNLIMQNND